MGCLVVLFAFISPRLAIFVLFLFTDLLSRAYDSWILPFLRFFLLPWTTLAYAAMWWVGRDGVTGFECRSVSNTARSTRRPSRVDSVNSCISWKLFSTSR